MGSLLNPSVESQRNQVMRLRKTLRDLAGRPLEMSVSLRVLGLSGLDRKVGYARAVTDLSQ
jgi:hypothetical protein